MSSKLANVISETEHLAAGAPEPAAPKSGDVLTLYSMRFCPFAQRARLVLQHKQVQHRIVNLNLNNKCQWFLDMSPDGKVPVLKLPGGLVLWDSKVTSEYIEAAFSKNPLYPSNPAERALIGLAICRGDDLIPCFYQFAAAKDDPQKLQAEYENVLAKLRKLQAELRGAKFLGGSKQVQMADLMIWPCMERLVVMMKKLNKDLPQSEFAPIKKWMQDMAAVPAVQQTRISEEIHLKFFDTLFSGKPNYDIPVR